MQNAMRLKAEAKFTKAKQQESQMQKERQKAQTAMQEKTARLRALRLAKDAADNVAAEGEEALKKAKSGPI